MNRKIPNRTARIAAFFALVALAACSVKPRQIAWSTERLSASACLIPGDSISVSYPVAAEVLAADSINLRIGEALRSIVGYDGDGNAGFSLAARIDTLLCGRSHDSLMPVMPYSVLIDGRVREYGKIASVRISSYVFTGGAHGLGTETFLNFDIRTGRLIPLAELVSDTARLNELNKIAFAEHFGDDLADLPLFVTPEQLPLPQNIGIDSAGLSMHYNPYEIAPYYVGSTQYLLPMDEAGPLLNPDLVNKEKTRLK